MDDITNIAVKRFPKKSVILKIDIEGILTYINIIINKLNVY